jgi:hypothetical protein
MSLNTRTHALVIPQPPRITNQSGFCSNLWIARAEPASRQVNHSSLSSDHSSLSPLFVGLLTMTPKHLYHSRSLNKHHIPNFTLSVSRPSTQTACTQPTTNMRHFPLPESLDSISLKCCPTSQEWRRSSVLAMIPSTLTLLSWCATIFFALELTENQ